MFKKKGLPVLVFVLLLLGMAYFPYLPILLLKFMGVDYNKFNFTMSVLFNLFCNIGYMFVLFLVYKDKLKKDFKEFKKKFADNFELAFKYYFIGVIIMIASNLIISLFFSNATAGNEEAVRDLITQAPLYMLFSVSIYAPFVEELIFRHSIKDCVITNKKNNFAKYVYIFISGFIFAGMHIFGQTTGALDYLYIIPYMSLGVAFAALYSNTDNIFSSITMHALHNTLTIILYFMSGGII